MRYLVDNMVQRSVTRLLRARGRSAVEVREVLAANAGDALVATYADVENRIVVTHDSLMAARCQRKGVRHVWLRMRESAAVTRLAEELEAVEAAFRAGQLRVELLGPALRRPTGLRRSDR